MQTYIKAFSIFCAAAVIAGPALAAVPGVDAADPADKAAIEKLIDGAKAEGSITYWDTVIQPDSNDELAAAFRKYYGLPDSFQVNFSVAGSLALITRVEQEIAAGKVTIDVAAVGNPPWAFAKAKEGAFMAYDSPEYKHYNAVFDNKLGLKPYFAFNGAYVFSPMWSTDTLPKFEGKSWKDISAEVPAGRLGYSDVSQSATHIAAYYTLRKVLPADYFKKVAELKPFFSNRSQQVTDRLIGGQDALNFAGQPNRAYQYNQKGAHLKISYPSEGVPLIPQDMFILAKAPHPNAAKLWVDFTLSATGQEIIARREIMISGRQGFKPLNPEYAPSLDQLKFIPVDWTKVTAAELKQAKDEWVDIFNP